ncbi:MAG: hypothetical protein IKO41_03955 [Lachnospiraceae bacterium]|nr:hypothetical protein [Lachnospiraceae bacterium]
MIRSISGGPPPPFACEKMLYKPYATHHVAHLKKPGAKKLLVLLLVSKAYCAAVSFIFKYESIEIRCAPGTRLSKKALLRAFFVPNFFPEKPADWHYQRVFLFLLGILSASHREYPEYKKCGILDGMEFA